MKLYTFPTLVQYDIGAITGFLHNLTNNTICVRTVAARAIGSLNPLQNCTYIYFQYYTDC